MRTTNLFWNQVIAGLIGVVLFALSLAAVGCSEPEPQPSFTPEPTAQQPPAATPEPAPEPPTPELVPEPEPEPQPVTYAEASAAYNEARYEDAADLFARYTDQHPSDPWGHYMHGLAAWKSGAFDEAETALRASLDHDVQHAKTWVNLSRVYLDADRPEDALVAVEEALALDATAGAALRQLGRAYHDLGQPDDAATAYQRALVLDPGDAWALNNLALLHIQAERFDEALPLLARATELRQDVATFYNNFGTALERTGYLHAARTAYTSALDLWAAYDKASQNLERVEPLAAEQPAESLDLTALAAEATDLIARWRQEVAQAEEATTPPEDISETLSDTMNPSAEAEAIVAVPAADSSDSGAHE